MKTHKMQMMKPLAVLVVVVSLLFSIFTTALAEETVSVEGVWTGTVSIGRISVDIMVTFTEKDFKVESDYYRLEGKYTIQDNIPTLSALDLQMSMALEDTQPRTMKGTIKFEAFEPTVSLTESLDDSNPPTVRMSRKKRTGDLGDLIKWYSKRK